jgi:DHA2 family methylenomycin A resistance protein-like MFS transporter
LQIKSEFLGIYAQITIAYHGITSFFRIRAMSSFRVFSPRSALAASALGLAMVLLDVSVVNIALDDIRHTFLTDVAGLQWVVNAYTLVFAALLLSSGALGDRLGARRSFAAGLALFTVASLGCGLAPELLWLVLARLLQGLGAALLVPNSLSLLQAAYVPGPARDRAVGWWGAIGAFSLAAGPVLGGVLVSAFGWRAIFLVNLPVGLAGLVLAWRYVAPDQPRAPRSLDWPGQFFAVLALVVLSVSLIQAARLGWTDTRVLAGLAGSIFAMLVFLGIQMRSAAPMLPLSLFRAPAFVLATVAGLAVNFSYYGLVFVLGLYFQVQQHLDARHAGLAFLPMTVVLVFANVLAGRLITRWGARPLMVAGLLLAACGYLALLPAAVSGNYAWMVLPMVVAGSGVALTIPTMTTITLSAVAPSQAGIASGVLNSARQTGGMLGVALFGYLIRDVAPVPFTHGLLTALLVSAVLLMCVAVFCLWALPRTESNPVVSAALGQRCSDARV